MYCRLKYDCHEHLELHSQMSTGVLNSPINQSRLLFLQSVITYSIYTHKGALTSILQMITHCKSSTLAKRVQLIHTRQIESMVTLVLHNGREEVNNKHIASQVLNCILYCQIKCCMLLWLVLQTLVLLPLPKSSQHCGVLADPADPAGHAPQTILIRSSEFIKTYWLPQVVLGRAIISFTIWENLYMGIQHKGGFFTLPSGCY